MAKRNVEPVVELKASASITGPDERAEGCKEVELPGNHGSEERVRRVEKWKMKNGSKYLLRRTVLVETSLNREQSAQYVGLIIQTDANALGQRKTVSSIASATEFFTQDLQPTPGIRSKSKLTELFKIADARESFRLLIHDVRVEGGKKDPIEGAT